jgi:Mor family transcriptional regulator
MKTVEEAPVVVTAKNGLVYIVDPETKKCRKVDGELSQYIPDLVDEQVTPLSTYQRYLKDKFGEDAPIKKGKIRFRDYRIYFDNANGFCVEDSRKKYQLVETGFEGVPTPKELGDWFSKAQVVHTPEELAKAVEVGKQKAAEKYDFKAEEEAEAKEVNFEKLRKRVLLKIKQIEDGTITNFDPTTFPDMIPFKKWKRKVTAVVKEWTGKKIRYPKLLAKVKSITEEEVFEVVDKTHRTSFTGTCLPEFKVISELKGNKLIVDGKPVDAVPFLQNYLLYYEPKAMQQLMRFANGEVDMVTLLKEPFHKDWKIEFDVRKLPNTDENAALLSAFCWSCGIVSPEDLVYGGLEVGEKILILRDGEWKKDTVMSIEEGVVLQKEIGLRKTDKWVKLNTEGK